MACHCCLKNNNNVYSICSRWRFCSVECVWKFVNQYMYRYLQIVKIANILSISKVASAIQYLYFVLMNVDLI